MINKIRRRIVHLAYLIVRCRFAPASGPPPDSARSFDVMMYTYYTVEVPIRSVGTPVLEGVHVFTGRADSCTAAVEAAHEAYDTARAATEAGAQLPPMGPNGWVVRAYRPGWEPDWTAAVVNPCGYTFSRSASGAFGW
ncbi:hypothetical protein ACFY2H_41800 [Streptomyces griseofuscus]|uniref:hypothetical protein n=1 Tax=Streptomyces griseofuscus TaxID=146922 RepID=UPI0036CDE36E